MPLLGVSASGSSFARTRAKLSCAGAEPLAARYNGQTTEGEKRERLYDH